MDHNIQMVVMIFVDGLFHRFELGCFVAAAACNSFVRSRGLCLIFALHFHVRTHLTVSWPSRNAFWTIQTINNSF